MRYTEDPQYLRRRRITAALLSVAILGAAVGAWLAVAPPRTEAQVTPPHSEPSALHADAPVDDMDAPPTSLERLGVTSVPEEFAEAVAHALFDWDTTHPIPLSAHTGRLVAVADPTGQASPGLVADLAGYLPTADTWAFLKPYYTRQWIEITSVTIPELWEQALAEAGPNGLAPGTTAYTIRGTRHRAGVWEGEPVISEHAVAFTVFFVCEPSYPTCHLLRLSRLDEPLE